MNYGWNQKFNNVVCYYQTPFGIALILDQLSNDNSSLREQEKMKKSEHRIQNNMISEENVIRSRINVTAKEHVPNMSDEKNVKNKR